MDFLNLGLIGFPLGHSLSPQLHHAALKAMGLAGEYRLYPVEEPAGLGQLLARLRHGELAGLNVTIPHKNNVLPFLDEISPLARRCGSANTLWMRAGRLHGDTSDIPGFLADLNAWLAPPGGPGRALLLGAGGSARAVAVALLESGWKVSIAARRVEQAARLSAELGGAAAALVLDAQALAGAGPLDLLVNTTPLGMYPKVDGCPWPENLPLPEGAAVYDLIYNPGETVLLRQARAAGLAARSGLGMLVEQAAISLERWSGRPVPRAPMWAAVG